MVKPIEKDGQTIYLCGDCELGYKEKETAQKCESFCIENNACSMEITKNAILKPKID